MSGDHRAILVDRGWLPDRTDAQYLDLKNVKEGTRFFWNQFYNRYNKVAVKLARDIMDSDENIVPVIAHEMHELNALRSMLGEDGSMSGERLASLINTDIMGNLHDHAWEIGDEIVKRMRSLVGERAGDAP